MTSRLLDVSTMPFERVYTCEDGSKIDLAKFLDGHYDAIQALAAADLIRANESFGFAMMEPLRGSAVAYGPTLLDTPEGFVWFVGGWGPARDRYIANAIRKLRPLLRHAEYCGCGASTLALRFDDDQEHFQDKVDQQNDDGTFPWGDFPWGGAVLVRMGELALVGAVSCLSEIEDDFIAKLFLGGIGKQIVEGDKLLSDD